MRLTDFFKEKYASKISSGVKITFRDEYPDLTEIGSFSNNMGSLSGVDLDFDTFSGYIFFLLGHGYLDFHVYNIIEDRDEIPVTVIETAQFDNDLVERIVKYFSNTKL